MYLEIASGPVFALGLASTLGGSLGLLELVLGLGCQVHVAVLQGPPVSSQPAVRHWECCLILWGQVCVLVSVC